MRNHDANKPVGKIIKKKLAVLVDTISIKVLNLKLYMLIRLAISIGGNCEKNSFNVPFMNSFLPK